MLSSPVRLASSMRDWKAIIGSNVKRLRLAKGLTQEQLAVDSEIDLTYAGGIERGRRNPSVDVLVRTPPTLAYTFVNVRKERGTAACP